MVKKYTHEKKEKLVEKINQMKQKKDFIKILEIIKKRENKPTKEIGNTTLMFFHDLKDETYNEINKYIKKVNKLNKKDTDSNEQEYKPYSSDEFNSTGHISPNLKYSNREKNLIKRTRYDKNLEEENGSDVMYCKFSVNNLTETEGNSTEKDEDDIEINK